MKKYLSLLAAAALILTAAGCGNGTEAETTTVEETTTTAAEETTAADTTEAEDTEADTEEAADDTAEDIDEDFSVDVEEVEGTLIVDEAYLTALAEKAPLYTEYMRISGTVPYTADLIILDEDGSEYMETLTSVASLDSLAIVMTIDGASTRIVMKDYNYYMISDETKEGIVQSFDADSWDEVISSSLSSQNYLDLDTLEVTTGEEEYLGKTYTFEELKDATMTAKCYFDTESGKVEYISTSYDVDGVIDTTVLKIGEYYNGIDESLFDLPEDYTYSDMSALAQE